MNALDVLDRLTAQGVQVTPRPNGNLWLEPASKIPPDLLEAVRENKPAILAHLRAKQAYHLADQMGDALRIADPQTNAPPKGYRLKYPEAQATKQELEDKQRQESISTMPPAWVAQRLQGVLAEKENELSLRKRDLASPYYADDEWTKRQIIYLQVHIAEITRYLKEGGELALPRCCRQADLICLVALSGFDICILSPGGCGYAISR